MLKPIAGGCALGVVLFFLACGIAAACGSPAALQCRAEAVLGLPLEPDAITLGDLKDVQRKVRACQQGDAGR